MRRLAVAMGDVASWSSEVAWAAIPNEDGKHLREKGIDRGRDVRDDLARYPIASSALFACAMLATMREVYRHEGWTGTWGACGASSGVG
jgi:hypothetical protein